MITLQWTLQFCRFQSVNVVFSLFLVFKFEFEKKKIENPRRRPLVTSLCYCGCHGIHLGSTLFQLIESTKNAHYMCQNI